MSKLWFSTSCLIILVPVVLFLGKEYGKTLLNMSEILASFNFYLSLVLKNIMKTTRSYIRCTEAVLAFYLIPDSYLRTEAGPGHTSCRPRTLPHS